MGKVIRGPWRRRHARASQRAAKRVSKSAVTPADEAVSVSSTDDHHSAGIVSLCHHLETAAAAAPVSHAIASRVGHNSTIDLKEDKSVMPAFLRQSVLKRKDNLSGDSVFPRGHNVLMGNTDFKEQFTARIAYARYKAGYTQQTMADALGIDQGTYHKYEGRSFMPHEMIPRFCALVETTTAWLYSGPAVDRPVEKKPRAPRKPRQIKPKSKKVA